MSGQAGMVRKAPMRDHQDRSRVWQAMRILRQWRIADVICTSEAQRNHVEQYVKHLVRADYVRVIQPRARGVAGGDALYQLVRNTGPLAPRIGKQGLLDPNLQPAPPEPGDELVTLRRRDYDHALLCVRACAGLSPDELRMRASHGHGAVSAASVGADRVTAPPPAPAVIPTPCRGRR